SGSYRSSHKCVPRRAACRLHQFGAGFTARPQGDERRVRPHGGHIRRKRSPRSYDRRRCRTPVGRSGRGRRNVRSLVSSCAREQIEELARAPARGSKSGPAWLTARPIAHRGLHDHAQGIIENTPSAATAAIAGRYGSEAGLPASAAGEAMVHHDDTLGRLTDGTGALRNISAAALKRMPFRTTADRMMTLGDLLDVVAGRVALLLEIKSRFDGDLRLA